MATTYSPAIIDGDLVLGKNGQLVLAPDIQTQMTVTIAAYDCIYDTEINSGLIPYLDSIPVSGFSTQALTNIVVQAYRNLISQGVISNLTVSIMAQVLNYVTIKVTAIDQDNNPILLSWSNS